MVSPDQKRVRIPSHPGRALVNKQNNRDSSKGERSSRTGTICGSLSLTGLDPPLLPPADLELIPIRTGLLKEKTPLGWRGFLRTVEPAVNSLRAR